MKIKLRSEEWYPVYTADEDEDGREYEIPDELAQRYMAALETFRPVLDELAEFIEDMPTDEKEET
jgi:hypothetical protein